MLGLSVPVEMGEDAKRALLEAGLLDKGWRIVRRDRNVIFPLTGRPEPALVLSLHGEIVEISPDRRSYTKEKPFDRIRQRLADLPEDIISQIPSRWERYGHVLVLRLPESLRPHFQYISRVYAEVLGCDTVILDRGGIAGEYREPVAEVVFGENTETTHLENGILYSFDAAMIMFSSGNIDERVRMAGLNCSGETVLDMFAGIGYFSLPIARYTGAARVISIEKNPVAYRYLLRNIRDNGLDNVEAYNMDNRDFEGEAVADRILMGYVGTTHLFLEKALSLLKDTGIIHYHETCPETLLPDRPLERLKLAAERNGRRMELLGTRRIKSYAPGVYHIVADARFERV